MPADPEMDVKSEHTHGAADSRGCIAWRCLRGALYATAAVSVALLVVSVLAVVMGWDRISCVEREIDVHSGDVRTRRFILLCEVSSRVEETPFSKLAKAAGAGAEGPVWVWESHDSILGTRGFSAAHGSIYECRDLMRTFDIYRVSEARRREVALEYLESLRTGEISHFSARRRELMEEFARDLDARLGGGVLYPKQ